MLHQMGYPKNQSVCKSEYKWKRNKLWQILTSKTLGALAPLIYVIEYYCWACSMKIFNGNILSIYDFSLPWQICGPPPKNQFLGSLRGVAFLGASNKKIGFRGTYQQLNQTKKIRKKIPIIFWDTGPRRGEKKNHPQGHCIMAIIAKAMAIKMSIWSFFPSLLQINS